MPIWPVWLILHRSVFRHPELLSEAPCRRSLAFEVNFKLTSAGFSSLVLWHLISIPTTGLPASLRTWWILTRHMCAEFLNCVRTYWLNAVVTYTHSRESKYKIVLYDVKSLSSVGSPDLKFVYRIWSKEMKAWVLDKLKYLFSEYTNFPINVSIPLKLG